MVLHLKGLECKVIPCTPDTKPEWLVEVLQLLDTYNACLLPCFILFYHHMYIHLYSSMNHLAYWNTNQSFNHIPTPCRILKGKCRVSHTKARHTRNHRSVVRTSDSVVYTRV